MRRTLIFICVIIITYSCVSLKKGKFREVVLTGGYYFVIQLQSVESDTIFFKTVEIYSPSPYVEVSPDDPSIVRLITIPLNNYNSGYLKGAKKKDIGNVMLLYTKPEWINKDNFVKFDYIDYLEWTDLSKMYRLGECKK